MTKAKTTPYPFRPENGLVRDLKKWAKENGRTITWAINEAIKQFLANNK